MPSEPRSARFPSALTLLFVLCLALTSLGAVALITASRDLSSSMRQVEHGLEVQRVLDNLQFALVNAEAGQRGFLLTGQPHLLEPYVDAVAKQAYYVGALQRLAQGNPEHERAVQAIKPLVDETLKQLSDTLGPQRATDQASLAEMLNIGKQNMDRVRLAIEGLRNVEESDLAQSRAEVDRRNRYALVVLLVSNAASLLGLAMLFLAMRRHDRRRQVVEEAISAREEEYRAIFEGSPLGQAECDPQTSRFLRSNRKLSEVTGYDADALRHTTVIDLLPRANRLDNARRYRELVAGERDVVTFEQPLLRQDGVPVWALVHIGAVRARDGNVECTNVIVQDVTERKHAEQALAGTYDVLRAITDGTRNLVFAKDNEGRYVFANSALQGALERRAPAILGKTDAELFPASCAAALVESDRRVMATRAPETLEETLQFAHEERVYLTTKAAFLDDMGELTGVVGVATDITERKREEEGVRVALADLERSVAEASESVTQAVEDERARFAMELHDELSAALSGVWADVSGVLTQLRRMAPQLVPRQERALDAVVNAGEKMRRIVSGLLPLALEQFGLATALVNEVEAWSTTTGVRAECTVEPGFPRLAPEQELALFRVAQESLTNVARYARASKVLVTLRHGKDAVWLTIVDDGVGLPEEAPLKRDRQGMRGMRRRLVHCGGILWVARRQGGRGTELVARMPLSAAAKVDERRTRVGVEESARHDPGNKPR